MRAAKILISIPLAMTIFVALARATVHFELDWPTHAQHHLVHQIVMFLGLSAVGFFLLYKPFGRGERWSWWALLIVGFAIHGGFWLGHPLTGFGEPATIPNTAQGILSLLFIAGLAVGWRQMKDAS